MSYPTFEEASAVVDQFLVLLADRGLDLHRGLPAESEALAMVDLLNIWRNREQRPADPRDIVRAAMGFVDLAGKIVSVQDHADFHQLWPHLEMIGSTSILQNAPSPITDSAANKVIELYIACLVMTFGHNVVLDDPNASKGDNPDVMFDFRGQRWALALKTLHSKKPRTIYENIKKGSDQIEASAATHGLVVLNFKNVLDHQALWPSPNATMPEADAIAHLKDQMDALASGLSEIPATEWMQILGPSRKAKPPVILIGQTATSTVPAGQSVSALYTSIKAMMSYLTPQGDPVGALKLAEALNHAMQEFT